MRPMMTKEVILSHARHMCSRLSSFFLLSSLPPPPPRAFAKDAVFASTSDGATLATAICFLRYCNADATLKSTFCAGSRCKTAIHASACIDYWDEFGRAARQKMTTAMKATAFDPEACAAHSTLASCDLDYCNAGNSGQQGAQCYDGDQNCYTGCVQAKVILLPSLPHPHAFESLLAHPLPSTRTRTTLGTATQTSRQAQPWRAAPSATR